MVEELVWVEAGLGSGVEVGPVCIYKIFLLVAEPLGVTGQLGPVVKDQV